MTRNHGAMFPVASLPGVERPANRTELDLNGIADVERCSLSGDDNGIHTEVHMRVEILWEIRKALKQIASAPKCSKRRERLARIRSALAARLINGGRSAPIAWFYSGKDHSLR